MDWGGNKACLTQRWHGTDSAWDLNRALDWQGNCAPGASEIVRFRSLGTNLDGPDNGAVYPGAYGLASNKIRSCGLDTFHVGAVAIYDYADTVKVGSMEYAHSVLTTMQFNIDVINAAQTAGAAYLTSIGIGNTVSDEPAGPTCWTGWHVHENNSDDATMHWDAWNSKWNTASTGDLYVNTSSSNWIRRISWESYIYE
jgi:hypothetical protein